MQHFSKNTESVTHYCKTCGRMTMHKVSAGRLTHCLEHAPKETKHAAQSAVDNQAKLFPDDEKEN